MKSLNLLYTSCFLILRLSVFAQQGIGINSTGALPADASALHVDIANKGILIPSVALTNTVLFAPVTGTPVTSLLVYNNNTINNVTPGYYYWDGAKWVRLIDANTVANEWRLTGNAGTNPATNFLGTTDNQDLVFRRNNGIAGLLNASLNSTSFGVSGLNNANTGVSNSAFGVNTLTSNTSGYFNTSVGTSSLPSNTTGFDNSSFGANALNANVTGSQNSAFGTNSLFNNLGSNNIAFGRNAGYINTIGSNNTFIGALSNATANNFTNAAAIGYNAIVGQSNAMVLGGTGVDAINVGIGTRVPANRLHIYDQIDGVFSGLVVDNRKVYGVGTGFNETSRIIMSLSEGGALNPNSRVMGFVESGTESETNSTEGFMAFGTRTVTAETEKMRITSTGNVGIGTSIPNHKLTIMSSSSNDGILLFSNGNGGEITGHDNAHFYVTNGRTVNATISMPHYGLAMPLVPGSAETWFAGYAGISWFTWGNERMRLDINGRLGLGTLTPTELLTVYNGVSTGTYTAAGWVHTSDARLKTNVAPLSGSLEKIKQIQGVNFDWKSGSEKRQIGFLAQDLEKILPEAVVVDSLGNYGVVYGNLTPLLVEAVKEQQVLIENLNKENSSLKDVVEASKVQNSQEIELLRKELLELKSILLQSASKSK